MSEQAKYKLSIVSWIALILWIVNIAFQFGTLTATTYIRDYVDKRNEELKVEIMETINQRFNYIDANMKNINDKIDRINERMKR